MVEVRRAHYRAGGSLILEDVSASFRPHRFNVILGPSGAGKSTLLKIATGMLRPSTGEVLYDGLPVSALASDALARKRAVLSPHVDPALPMHARDVVLMGRYPHYDGTPLARDLEIVECALERVGLTAKAWQPYPTLSDGERQQVQLARVLAQIWNYDHPREHRYLFLDEPTTGLDVQFRLQLLDTARDLLGYNCTVVAVLHDLNLAFQYGDSFFLLGGGQLIRQTDAPHGITKELIERVFHVRAHRGPKLANDDGYWRFRL